MIGLDHKKLAQLKAWSSEGTAVTIRFENSSTCKFLRELERKEEGPELELKGKKKGNVFSETRKVVTTVKEASPVGDRLVGKPCAPT